MIQDLLRAARALRKEPLANLAIVLILALGIGANTAIFSIVDAVLLRPLPYTAVDRMARIEESTHKRPDFGVPGTDFRQLRDRSDLFDNVAAYIRDTVTVTGGGPPEQVVAVRGLGLFPLLGVQASLGRPLVEGDDEYGTRNVAVLSDRLWRRRFNADSQVIGRLLKVSDESYTIVGVMPRDFEFRFPEAELWMPLRFTASTPWLQVAARLKAGIQPAQAENALKPMASRLASEQPKERAGFQIRVSQWRSTADDKYKATLIFILAAVGLVLMIACADVSGLLLSRAIRRQKEIAIRASLGAGLWRVARLLLSETLVLAAVASAAGVAVAGWLLQILEQQLTSLPVVMPHLQRVELNGRVLLFNTLLCVLLAVLCSLAPVVLAARTDLNMVLRGGLPSGPRNSSRLFSILIGLEAGFAFLLLVGSGLMVRSLIHLQQADHGFRPDHVLTLRVPVGSHTQARPTGKYDTRPRQMAYYREILERVKTIPRVKAAAVVNNLPLSGINSSLMLRGPEGKTPLISARTISPEYFTAMGIPLLAGRAFTDGDRTGTPSVAIVNQHLARELFPDRSAVGQRLIDGESNAPGPTIVGIVKDTWQMGYDKPTRSEVYIPYQQFIFATFMSAVVVRTADDPMNLAPTLRQQVWAVDPNQPVVKVETLDDVITNSIWRPRFSAWIFSAMGGLSLLLTAIGVYSIVAYTSTLRAKEVGIRIALGAAPRQVMGLMLRRTMLPLFYGLTASILVSLLLSRLLKNLLYEVSNNDPLTYLGAALLLIALGAMASLQPARRASKRDPLTTLRME